MSVDVHGECLACWGPRFHGTVEGAQRYEAVVAKAVERGWVQAPGDGATQAGPVQTASEVDLGDLILRKLDAIIAEQSMQRVVLKHALARLYGGRNAPPVPDEVWEWLGIEIRDAPPTIYRV